MRLDPPGLEEWSAEDLANKLRYNLRKLEVLAAVRELSETQGLFGSQDLSNSLDITRRNASMILLNLKRQGIVTKSEGVGEREFPFGRQAIMYLAKPKLLDRQQILQAKIGKFGIESPGGRALRSFEL